ncbi:hypothetical protein SR882_08775 [Guyparkeria halophila]|uniref:Uncharacterized protein n=1 Tax=Guyparkeria halophila TaxID=47960 RepID=A0ABZ0YX87_9GAMM|nr:hypothetical protein [Guyparkeria halophila]WQH15847.1 hypothetical protein SR882_08775 [Guyparkeria halophila]
MAFQRGNEGDALEHLRDELAHEQLALVLGARIVGFLVGGGGIVAAAFQFAQALRELLDVDLQSVEREVGVGLAAGVAADAVAQRHKARVGLFHCDQGAADGQLEQLDQP